VGWEKTRKSSVSMLFITTLRLVCFQKNENLDEIVNSGEWGVRSGE
jgi:hypothetical protein